MRELAGKSHRCSWSVANRFKPQGPCGRRAVDGEHCAQHAKMAAEVDRTNQAALEKLREQFGEVRDA